MKCGLLVATLFLLLPALSQADPLVITVDENGHGTAGTQPLAVEFIPDPAGSGRNILTYVLPFIGSGSAAEFFVPLAGDVVLAEPSSSAEPIYSDLLRFFNVTTTIGSGITSSSTTQSFLSFYSDLPGPGDNDLADIGVPPASPLALILTEVGPEEGPNGFTYTPTGGIGSVLSTPITYVFVSDAAPTSGPGTPLPASGFAGLVLLMGFGAWRVIRKRATI